MIDSAQRQRPRRLRYERDPDVDWRPPTPPAPPRILGRAIACPREALAAVAARKGESLASLSRLLGHAPGYLHRFIHDSVPVALAAKDHQRLADWLGVDARELGVRDLWAPHAA